MGTRNPTLLRSHWIINNQLNLPWVGIDNGQTTVRGLIQLTLPITIFLDTLFTDTPGFTSRYGTNSKSAILFLYKSGLMQEQEYERRAVFYIQFNGRRTTNDGSGREIVPVAHDL